MKTLSFVSLLALCFALPNAVLGNDLSEIQKKIQQQQSKIDEQKKKA